MSEEEEEFDLKEEFDFNFEENLEEYDLNEEDLDRILESSAIPSGVESAPQEVVDAKEVMSELFGEEEVEEKESSEEIFLQDPSAQEDEDFLIATNSHHKEEEFELEEEVVIGEDFLSSLSSPSISSPSISSPSISSPSLSSPHHISHLKKEGEVGKMKESLGPESLFKVGASSSFWGKVGELLLELVLYKEEVAVVVGERRGEKERKEASTKLAKHFSLLLQASSPQPKFKYTLQMIGNLLVQFIKLSSSPLFPSIQWDTFYNLEDTISLKLSALSEYVQKRVEQDYQSSNPPSSKQSSNPPNFEQPNRNSQTRHDQPNRSTQMKGNISQTPSSVFSSKSSPLIPSSQIENKKMREFLKSEGVKTSTSRTSGEEQVMSKSSALSGLMKSKELSKNGNEADDSSKLVKDLISTLKQWKTNLLEGNANGQHESNTLLLLDVSEQLCVQLEREENLRQVVFQLREALSQLTRIGYHLLSQNNFNATNVIEQHMRNVTPLLKEILQEKQLLRSSQVSRFSINSNNSPSTSTRGSATPSNLSKANPPKHTSFSVGVLPSRQTQQTQQQQTQQYYLGSYKKGKRVEKKRLQNADPPSELVFRLINERDLEGLEKQCGVTGKVNFEMTDILGNTPLHIACKIGCKEIIQYLLERGAVVNAVNNQKKTPLVKLYKPLFLFMLLIVLFSLLKREQHCLLERSEVELARYLIIHGADKRLTDRWGKTPLDYSSNYKAFLNTGNEGGWIFATVKKTKN